MFSKMSSLAWKKEWNPRQGDVPFAAVIVVMESLDKQMWVNNSNTAQFI